MRGKKRRGRRRTFLRPWGRRRREKEVRILFLLFSFYSQLKRRKEERGEWNRLEGRKHFLIGGGGGGRREVVGGEIPTHYSLFNSVNKRVGEERGRGEKKGTCGRGSPLRKRREGGREKEKQRKLFHHFFQDCLLS